MGDMGIPLPFDIQGEILKRVPEVKSLLRFRSVSKSWKSFIDSPQFITGYNPQPPRRHIFVEHYDSIKWQCVSFIDTDDDDSDSHGFGQNKVPLTIPIPEPIQSFQFCISQGLFCLYKKIGKLPVAYLWNPSIRKLSAAIDLPNMYDDPDRPKLGFVVSPYSSDPKLVKIHSNVYVSDLKPRRVEVYSLSTREWRTLSSEVLPRSSVIFNRDHHVATGKYIFWLAQDRKYENGIYMERQMIIVYDMISEKFMEIYPPDHMTKDGHRYNYLSLFKIRESLAVVVSSFNHHSVNRRVSHVWMMEGGVSDSHVWMMEGGVSDSFTKMYSIPIPDEARFSLLAFRNNGLPIIAVHYCGECELAVMNLTRNSSLR